MSVSALTLPDGLMGLYLYVNQIVYVSALTLADDSMRGRDRSGRQTGYILILVIKTRLTLDVSSWDQTNGYYGGTE